MSSSSSESDSEHSLCKGGSSFILGSLCKPGASLRGGGGSGVDEGPGSSAKRKDAVPPPFHHYEFALDDFRSAAVKVKAQQLTIQWADEDAVPNDIRDSLPMLQQAVETNGNGACAIHSVFGRPSAARELFYPDARELAIQCLRGLPEAAVSEEAFANALNSIYTSLWNEFAKPVLNNASTVEGRLFWAALERIAPEVAVEAKCRVDLGREAEAQAESARERMLVASRSFFTVTNEENLIRPVAVQLGYLNARTKVSVGSQGQILMKTDPGAFGTEEGLQSAKTEDGYVRGLKRVKFPCDGPSCRYSALFDTRSIFDPLRASFLVYGDPNVRATSFLQMMEERGANAVNTPFLAEVQAWMQTTSPVEAPPDFGVRAWSAYLACIREGSYFFSIDELLSICMQSSTRVLIFKEVEGTLSFAGGTLRGQGPLIITKLHANNQRQVRSHFERLVPLTLVQEFMDTLREEAQERIREEARLRQQRQEQEAKAAAERERRRKEAADEKAKNGALPPPPPPHPEGRPSKKFKSDGVRDKGAKADEGDDNVNRMQGEATKNAEDDAQQEVSHFNVRCAAHGFSKDPRAQLEAAVETLAAQMREYPTLPSEVHDASLPRIEAFRDDTAPQLPPKHCAFKSCPWELNWDATANAGTERGREKKL